MPLVLGIYGKGNWLVQLKTTGTPCTTTRLHAQTNKPRPHGLSVQNHLNIFFTFICEKLWQRKGGRIGIVFRFFQVDDPGISGDPYLHSAFHKKN